MAEFAFVSTAKDLGEMVCDARNNLGWSQTELAQRSNTSQRFVSEFERGKQTAEIGKVMQLLQALGLKVCVTNARTADESRKIVDDGIARIVEDLELKKQRRSRKKLVDYLAEQEGNRGKQA